MKKNLLSVFFLLFPLLTLLTSCTRTSQPSGDGYIWLDEGRIGIKPPPRGRVVSGWLEELRLLNDKLVFLLDSDTTKKPARLISVSRYAGDSLVPMEIAFIEFTVKNNGSAFGIRSDLVDFGVYERDGRLYRYKLVKIGGDRFSEAIEKAGMGSSGADTAASTGPEDFYRILYYMMKNDRDSVLYELGITVNEDEISSADSLLFGVVSSLRFKD